MIGRCSLRQGRKGVGTSTTQRGEKDGGMAGAWRDVGVGSREAGVGGALLVLMCRAGSILASVGRNRFKHALVFGLIGKT